jgi:hypothetical protein
MKFIEQFDFLFKPQSNLQLDSLCGAIVNNLETIRIVLSKMPYEEVVAFKLYSEQRGSVGASIWAESELKRREFLFNKAAVLISLAAFLISIIALFN